MGRKAKYSNELKIEIGKRYLKGEPPSALAIKKYPNAKPKSYSDR
jgi:hypothetical protein